MAGSAGHYTVARYNPEYFILTFPAEIQQSHGKMYLDTVFCTTFAGGSIGATLYFILSSAVIKLM